MKIKNLNIHLSPVSEKTTIVRETWLSSNFSDDIAFNIKFQLQYDYDPE